MSQPRAFPAFSIRWLFAIAVVICGIYVLLNAGSSKVEVVTGVGFLLAGVGLVVP